MPHSYFQITISAIKLCMEHHGCSMANCLWKFQMKEWYSTIMFLA